ncbi:MAG: Maf family nucleotide pyrophosphatase [Halieaceae bacterium]|jgi:septum formation protein|nr:Maf family nucleotide pyrophosphatase [Halieaceae bacterium]
MTQHLILASTSVYRRQLLERLRLPFTCVAPEVIETPLPDEAPDRLAQRLAIEKAAAVATGRPDALVIGGDQVCVRDGTMVGKPGSRAAAAEQLSASSGKRLVFFTGLCLMSSDGDMQTAVVASTVTMRALSDSEIARYIELDRPVDCAGSFKWESLGVALFERLESTDPTALQGLPLITLCDMLRHAGLDPLA